MSYTARLHALFHASNLHQLVELGRRLTHNPIILTDLTHRVLEMSDEPGLTDSNWLEIKVHRSIPLNQAVSNRYRESIGKRAPVLDRGLDNSLPLLRMAIAHSGRLLGFLEVPCYHCVPEQDEMDTIALIADAACLIMLQDGRYMDTPSNMLEFFICDLLEGRLTDENLIRERCQFFRWELSGYFRVMTISPGPEATEADCRLEQHREQLSRLFPSIINFIYGTELKVIAPMQEDTANDGRFFDDIINYLKQNRLQGGISRSICHMGQMKQCSEEANKALELGRLFASQEILFFYDKYSSYHAMELCGKQMDLMRFCHSAIFTLADYDRTHETALLETLHAYLYCQQNLAEASAKLFIHRNTLTNRLSKIHDLVHVDLEDIETVFHLLYSYHILEYYGATVMLDYETRMKLSPSMRHQ